MAPVAEAGGDTVPESLCQYHCASTGCWPVPSAPAAATLPLFILPEIRQKEPCWHLRQIDDACLELISPLLCSSDLAHAFFFPQGNYFLQLGQGQVEWGSERSDLVDGILPMAHGWD